MSGSAVRLSRDEIDAAIERAHAREREQRIALAGALHPLRPQGFNPFGGCLNKQLVLAIRRKNNIHPLGWLRVEFVVAVVRQQIHELIEQDRYSETQHLREYVTRYNKSRPYRSRQKPVKVVPPPPPYKAALKELREQRLLRRAHRRGLLQTGGA